MVGQQGKSTRIRPSGALPNWILESWAVGRGRGAWGSSRAGPLFQPWSGLLPRAFSAQWEFKTSKLFCLAASIVRNSGCPASFEVLGDYILSVLFVLLPFSPAFNFICLFCSTYFHPSCRPRGFLPWSVLIGALAHSARPTRAAPKSRAFSPSSLLQPKAFSLSSASTVCLLLTPQPLNPFEPARVSCSSPRVTRPSSPSNTFFLATSRTPTRPSRQAAVLPFPLTPPPPPSSSLYLHRRPINPKADSRLRPLARTSATDRRTDRCGEGEDWVILFVQVAHLCVSHVSYPAVAASPRLSLVPRPSPLVPSPVRRPSSLHLRSGLPPGAGHQRALLHARHCQHPHESLSTMPTMPMPIPAPASASASHQPPFLRNSTCMRLLQVSARFISSHSTSPLLASKLPYPDLGPPNPSSFSCLGVPMIYPLTCFAV